MSTTVRPGRASAKPVVRREPEPLRSCPMIDDLWTGPRWERRLRTAGVHALVVVHAGTTERTWFRRHDGADRLAKRTR